MTAQARAAVFLGLSAAARYARPLIAPMRLYDVALTRTQAGGARSTALAEDGVTWVEYAVDTPRYNGFSQRLAIGGSRTNGIRNPRMEGATAGDVSAGGALPTNVSVVTANGLTTTVVGVTRESGVDVLHVRFSGTASGTQYIMQFEAADAIAASASQVWSASFFARVVDATLPPTAHSRRISAKNVSLANIASDTLTISPTSALTRFASAATISSSAFTTAVTLDYRFTMSNGANYDFTMALGWPQLELAAFPSMPILPAVGTPAAATRSADVITDALSDIGIPDSGAGTYLWSGMLPQNAPGSLNQTILQIDDGTDNNRLFVRNTAGGASIVAARALAGSVVASSTAGTMTAGTPFRLGVVLDGAGTARISVNGAAVVTATGGPTSGLTSLLIGGDRAGQPLFGETGYVRFSPRVATDEELRNLVEGMPI